MATVHLGRMMGPVGFSRTVAIKRLHPHHAQDPEFVSMFLDEARLAGRIQHPNVVATLDVVASHGELFLVMDFVLGESLSQLVRSSRTLGVPIPLRIVSAIVIGVLSGLHAAHEAKSERGEEMGIVHRDVSPQNVLVGVDGVVRVVDFGVAKAVSRLQSTQDGQLKGKLSYMAPEQILRRSVDRRADLYATGVLTWELVTGRRLFTADDPAATIAAVLEAHVPAPSSLRPDAPPGLDTVVRRAVAARADERYATALEFVEAIEAVLPPAPAREVSEWVARVADTKLKERRELLGSVERAPSEGASLSDGALELAVPGPKTPEDARELANAATAAWSPLSPDTPQQPASTAILVDIAGPQPASHRVWRRVGLGLLAAAATAGVVVLLGSHRSAPSGPAALAAGGASAAGSDSLPVIASAPRDPVLAPSAPPSASEERLPGMAPATNRRAPVGRPPSASRPAAPAGGGTNVAPARSDCNPSFTIDESGIKRFKPWCL
jgi:serine/threonine-protein kinase